MYTLKCLFILQSLLFLQTGIQAQDKLNIKFGKLSLQDFEITSPLIDSNTSAVVVADVGKSEFVANSYDLTFSLVFTQKKRIKIINKKGFDAATITIPLYVSDGGKMEKLEGLKAYTYNIENGKIIETNVEKADIFIEKHDKNWEYRKFTFPSIKEGSIIEYSYQVKSDFFYNFQPWVFQGEYPILWSQYEAKIPEFFKYVILSQGYQPFFINKIDNSRVKFSFTQHIQREGGGINGEAVSSGRQTFDVEGKIDSHTWVMKAVPAIKREPFTTTIRNAIAKIEFQLNQIAYPNTIPINYMEGWEKVSKELLQDEKFGESINRANKWLDDDVKIIIKSAATQKEKAKKIYEYVRDNFTCNDKEGIHITSGLKEVFKNKNGSVADINLLLIAMLHNLKIDANPVILSTRSHGYTHEIYPLMDRFNYVIAQVMLDNVIVYLDATTPRLAFGKLPSEVYNGHARVINNKMATPVYFIADSLKEASGTHVLINNTEKGGLEGKFTHDLGFYESMAFRNKMAKTTRPEYEKTLRELYTEEISIENVEIDSLKLTEEPVSVKYDLKLKAFEQADIVYFNPMLGEAIKSNPFVAAERFYPVEMPYTIYDIYTLNMEIPKGYKVDELPKSVRLNFNEDEGMFEYLISNSGENIQMKCRLVFKKTNFLNEDYQPLRDFYSFIVKKEAEQIVFKKIKL